MDPKQKMVIVYEDAGILFEKRPDGASVNIRNIKTLEEFDTATWYDVQQDFDKFRDACDTWLTENQ